MGPNAIMLGISVMMLIVIYPFGKRFLKYPQLLLAVIFNSGALFASIAILGKIGPGAIFIYLGSFFWILYYDIVYAHQDKVYDKDLSIYSMALTKFGDKKWMQRYCKMALFFWLFAGVFAGLNFVYYIIIGGMLYVFRRQISNLQLDNPKLCMSAFAFNKYIGLALFLAIALGRI